MQPISEAEDNVAAVVSMTNEDLPPSIKKKCLVTNALNLSRGIGYSDVGIWQDLTSFLRATWFTGYNIFL